MSNSNNNEEASFNLEEYAEDLWKRIINKKLLTIEEIHILSKYGLTCGLIYMNEILEHLEEYGELSTRKAYTNRFLFAIQKSIDSEFYFRTNHFFQNGLGYQIPMDLINAFSRLKEALMDLDFELSFGEFDSSNYINQTELIYLFKALSARGIIRRSPVLIAEALDLLTDYSYESLEKTAKNTFGGDNPDKKDELLKKLKIILSSY